MSKYTKGPWIIKEQPVKHLGFYIQQDGFKESQRAFIGEVGGGTQPFNEIEANAKLIASAPDLLQALQKIASWDMPITGQFWDDEKKEPMSYAAAYGSNGERDFIKSIAIKAITKAIDP